MQMEKTYVQNAKGQDAPVLPSLGVASNNVGGENRSQSKKVQIG